MAGHPAAPVAEADAGIDYVLDEQVGFLLRKAYQRHMTIFSQRMTGGLTAMQFSTLFRLFSEKGSISQNALGRQVAMDAATTKGVISRLEQRGLLATERDPSDKRRYILHSTPAGRAMVREALPVVQEITEATLAPLTRRERATLLRLLGKLA